MKFNEYAIILASTSPRRIELLAQTGLNFQIVPPGIDETVRRGESPRAMVARLAREKAEAVASRQAGTAPTLVIAADTTVVAPDGRTILGKPRDSSEARRMLSLLAGRTHVVLTGYCIWPQGRRMSQPLLRVVRSRVGIRALSRPDINAYIRTGEPMDKAGSYAAQGIGMALIQSIQGSYTNVVGLPMCQLLLDLERSFGLALFAAQGVSSKKQRPK